MKKSELKQIIKEQLQEVISEEMISESIYTDEIDKLQDKWLKLHESILKKIKTMDESNYLLSEYKKVMLRGNVTFALDVIKEFLRNNKI